MKSLKLLNRKYLSIILFSLFFGFTSQSQEPVDIWNVEATNTIGETSTVENNEDKEIPQNSIYKMQSENEGESNIEETETLVSKEIKLIGLYDPEENGLDINMWSKSNGDQILNIFEIDMPACSSIK